MDFLGERTTSSRLLKTTKWNCPRWKHPVSWRPLSRTLTGGNAHCLTSWRWLRCYSLSRDSGCIWRWASCWVIEGPYDPKDLLGPLRTSGTLGIPRQIVPVDKKRGGGDNCRKTRKTRHGQHRLIWGKLSLNQSQGTKKKSPPANSIYTLAKDMFVVISMWVSSELFIGLTNLEGPPKFRFVLGLAPPPSPELALILAYLPTYREVVWSCTPTPSCRKSPPAQKKIASKWINSEGKTTPLHACKQQRYNDWDFEEIYFLFPQNIFLGEDIRRQLPRESAEFDEVNINWKQITVRLNKTKNALRGTHYEGMYPSCSWKIAQKGWEIIGIASDR